MNNEILNPGTIRVWGYDRPKDVRLAGVDILTPEVIMHKGVRCSGFDFYKHWLKPKVKTEILRSIIRKQKQNAAIKICRK